MTFGEKYLRASSSIPLLGHVSNHGGCLTEGLICPQYCFRDKRKVDEA